MFCSQCGIIIGRKFPQGLYKCPQCDNIMRVAAFRINDGKDSHEFVGLDSSRRRLCGLFVDEAKLRLLLKQQTERPDDWLPQLLELEEERLKAFVKGLGWIIASIHTDRGPISPEEERPFVQFEKDIKDSIVNTIVVTDFAKITRMALHKLYEMAQDKGVEILAIAPHKCDENLEMTHVDYDAVPGYLTKSPLLERIWNDRCGELVRDLLKKYQWHWISYAADLLAKEIGDEKIQEWRAKDASCTHRHWKEVLTYWAVGHVREHKLYMDIEIPKLKNCNACRRRYLVSAIPIHLTEMNNFRKTLCRTCLSKAFYYSPKRFTKFLRAGPPSKVEDMDAFIALFRSLDKDGFNKIVKKVLEWREKSGRSLGSNVWLKAFIDAGFLKGYGALSSSETVFRTLDGHACMSVGAAMLDNFFHLNGIPHKVEVRYPRHVSLNKAGTLRADFVIGETLVEYAGLWGEEEMKKDMEAREGLCEKNRIDLIKVYTEDLICTEILHRKFKDFIPPKEEGSVEEPESQVAEEKAQEQE
ncbi:hypothetical protein ACFLU6_06495 [Acidobacteriota bacterium]